MHLENVFGDQARQVRAQILNRRFRTLCYHVARVPFPTALSKQIARPQNLLLAPHVSRL